MIDKILPCKKCNQYPIALAVPDMENEFIRYVCGKCDMVKKNGDLIYNATLETIFFKSDLEARQQWNEANAK